MKQHYHDLKNPNHKDLGFMQVDFEGDAQVAIDAVNSLGRIGVEHDY
jgi:hypothetical protein